MIESHIGPSSWVMITEATWSVDSRGFPSQSQLRFARAALRITQQPPEHLALPGKPSTGHWLGTTLKVSVTKLTTAARRVLV